MLTYGDGVADVDVEQLLEFFHRSTNARDGDRRAPSSRFGELIASGDRVTAFSEKPQMHDGLINGGFFVLEPEVLDYLSDDADACSSASRSERLARRGPVGRVSARRVLAVHGHVPRFPATAAALGLGEAAWKTW